MLLKQVKVFNDEDGGIDVVLEFNGILTAVKVKKKIISR